MNYFQPYSLPAEQAVLAAWDSQLAELANCPALVNTLAKQRELFPRFAAHYVRLRALPRGTRRALQRKLARARKLISIQPEWQRKLAGSLAGAALLLALAQSASAATITVTTNVPDINDGDGQCSLIEAIINANNDAATHPDCPAGSGADTIVLPKGSTITLTKYYTDYFGYTGLPGLNSSIIIEGNGSTVTRKSDAPLFRLMAVYGSGNVTVKNITLSGGSLYSYTESTYGYCGGAIYNGATLALINATISGNRGTGGGIYNSGIVTIDSSTISGNIGYNAYGYGGGGGISNVGTLTISNSRILNNTAAAAPGWNHDWSAGGGILNYHSGILHVSNSTISGNKVAGFYADDDGWGGGIYSRGYTVFAISSSTISGNRAGFGSGIYNWTYRRVEASTIIGSTIAGNIAVYAGGGIYTSGNLVIENSSISGNIAKGNSNYPGYGGGIYNDDSLLVTSSTIAANTSGDYGGGIFNRGPAVIRHSLISGNKSAQGREIDNRFTVQADAFNIFGADGDAGAYNFTPGQNDIVPATGVTSKKILAPLKDNGGSTLTHALVKGSPAIDTAPLDVSCPATDQRGVARPQGGGCDIGAVEYTGKTSKKSKN
jgi:hypothetical protein